MLSVNLLSCVYKYETLQLLLLNNNIEQYCVFIIIMHKFKHVHVYGLPVYMYMYICYMYIICTLLTRLDPTRDLSL